MKRFLNQIQKIQFEFRIFISLTIVLFVYASTLLFFSANPSNFIIIGNWIGLSPELSNIISYSLLVLVFIGINILRMWAGSILTSETVMSFPVQYDSLKLNGPYQLVRNPIYLADLTAMFCFALCLPTIGFTLPVLFYIHYNQLVKYEEKSLKRNFTGCFRNYSDSVPRLLPNFRSICNLFKYNHSVVINYDGFRHNSLYLLFVPGFIVAAFTGEFLYCVLTGIPAVVDWAVVHTKIGLNKTKIEKKRNNNINNPNLKIFNDIVYANCWEDPQIDREAFGINSDDIIFSITSGGCNVLSFLIDNPRKILSLDLNPHQNYLLELKIAAFKSFSHKNILEFFGVNSSSQRIQFYKKLRSLLNPTAANYWDSNQNKIKRGIIHCGRFEKYMRLIRVFLIIIRGKSLILKFFNSETQEEQYKLYSEKWENIWWKLLMKVLLSRKTMSFLFDKAFFTYLKGSFSFGDHFAEKIKKAFTELPVKENYFLSYILLGKFFNEHYLPIYLRRENYKKIRSRIDRIEIITDDCKNYFSKLPDSYISKFNFTNIFEWISEKNFENLLREAIRVARHGAILTYRNLLVSREHPKSLGNLIISDKNKANSLHQKDLSFIYNNYVVEHIYKENEKCATRYKKLKTAEC